MSGKTPTLEEVIRAAMRSMLLDLHTMLPCSVEKYDATTKKASIVPLLKKKYLDGRVIQLPVINDVPVQWPSAGGAILHFPLENGDTGMGIFCERSLDVWLSGDGSAVNPNDTRHHDITDAVFIPGLYSFTGSPQGVTATSVHLKYGSAEIELTQSGVINILGGTIKFGAGVEKALLGQTAATLYAGHTHIAAGVPTSAPSNTLDTALSGKVYLE